MRSYTVTMPIGGHAVVTVEAETPEEAKEAALMEVATADIESWDVLDPVSRGNILSFPSPWEIVVTDDGEVD